MLIKSTKGIKSAEPMAGTPSSIMRMASTMEAASKTAIHTKPLTTKAARLVQMPITLENKAFKGP